MLRVGLIGPGRAGQALVRLLPPSKYELGAVLSRRFTSARRATRQMHFGEPTDDCGTFSSCSLILIAVPDHAIAAVARRLAGASFSFRRKVVLHTSGALDSTELAPLRARGAAVGSIHPLQTFGRRVLSLAGVHFAVEGDEAALRLAQSLVTDWHGKLLRIKPGRKALFHAGVSFASPFFTPLMEAAVRLMGRAGIPPKTAIQALRPLLSTTLDNYAHTGRQSWTGPLAHGDVATIRRHLEALDRDNPMLARYYRVSALAALALFSRHHKPQQILTEGDLL
ncbi:MAG: DUF2520 domain-containing protein [Acidobacteria bacterium]|nr:DUF2520 domain-containing protein [Acidobacteriota bacterium]